MAKILYRVGEGANLEALPRGTKVGDEIRLTEAEALYERDMGRLIDIEAEKAGAAETAKVVTDEPQDHPVDHVLGALQDLAADGHLQLTTIGPAVHGAQTIEADGIEKTPVEGDTLAVSEDEAVASKSRRR